MTGYSGISSFTLNKTFFASMLSAAAQPILFTGLAGGRNSSIYILM